MNGQHLSMTLDEIEPEIKELKKTKVFKLKQQKEAANLHPDLYRDRIFIPKNKTQGHLL